MAQTLIADHPAGWSCLLYLGADALGPFTRADFDLSGFVGASSPIRGHYPDCYCHGQRNEPPQRLTCRCPRDRNGCGPIDIEWAYVLTAEGMRVVTSHTADHRPVHRFVDRVIWEEAEPDWRRMERAVRTGALPAGDDVASPSRQASSD
ncbi:hypothetical protein [Streptomonospora salina]|uniref:Uncharacterized protein n=1 Tax=Streptomonospora salina TaxID=104205 RepID=A0A841E7K6_9ACTN|nr:hypothetical protein [Streptomonospora salina]MBB5996540.1 hypothetical protein [Streptomonospora salina]